VSSAAKTRELTVAEGGGGLNVDHTSRQSAVFLFACGVAFVASVTATVYFCRSMYCEMEMLGGWTMSMMWMRMPGQTWFASALSFLLMWLAMMVTMMMPSALPTFLKTRRPWASLCYIHSVWILRHLAGSHCWNLCARTGVCGCCDAVGIV